MVVKVSVIIVNYNGLPYIDACISSILNQDLANYEVIFVDNGSTDGSFEYAKQKFPKLIFVSPGTNTGYAGGINAALPFCSGEYIAPINMDTEVSQDWLSPLTSFMDKNPRVGAVNPKILLYDQQDKYNSKGLDVHMSGIGFCRKLLRKDNHSTLPEKVTGITGCSYMIRRNILEKMGGAPQECFMYYDDVTISWLVTLMDYELFCVPEAMIYHKYNLTMNPFKYYLLEKGRHELLLTTLKPSTLILFSPIFLAVEALLFCYGIAKGWVFFHSKMRAYGAIWISRKEIGQRRLRYFPLKKITDFTLMKRLRWNMSWGQLLQILAG
jgi:GT2 family glycosyltransferase